jgi:multidrug efflux pump subunit AcrA (membrane-fusion protein)
MDWSMAFTRISLLAAALIVLGCERPEAPASPTIRPERGDVWVRINISGRIRSERSSILRAPIDAQLVSVFKTVGSQVREGEPLISIEQPSDESKLTGMVQAEGLANQLKLQIEQAKVKIASLEREMNSTSRLLQSGSVAPAEYERVKTAYDLALKEKQTLEHDEQVARKTVKIKLQSSNNKARTLTAPSSGTLTALWMPEESITKGMSITKDTILATIEEPGHFILRGEVPEADYLRLKIGQAVAVNLVHGNARSWSGVIKSISPVPKQDQMGIGRFEISIAFKGNQSDLRSGLEAHGAVTLSEKRGVLRLPRSAVRPLDGRYFVSVPGPKGSVHKEIRVGLVGDQFLEVTAGVDANTVVYQAYVRPNP